MKKTIKIILSITAVIGTVFTVLAYINDVGFFAEKQLEVEIITNKGTSYLEFIEDEQMRIRIKANKKCYLQLIYYLQNGERLLLLENKKISSDLVDKEYELPYSFIIAAPFGRERLQLNASTKKMKKVQTEQRDEYKYITDDFVVSIPDNNKNSFEKVLIISTKKRQ